MSIFASLGIKSAIKKMPLSKGTGALIGDVMINNILKI